MGIASWITESTCVAVNEEEHQKIEEQTLRLFVFKNYSLNEKEFSFRCCFIKTSSKGIDTYIIIVKFIE